MVLLYSVYFFWQQFHYGKQNYGLAIWQESSPLKNKWINLSFYLGTITFSLIGLFSSGAQNFFGYILLNPFFITLSKTQVLMINGTLLVSYLAYKPSEWKMALQHVGLFSGYLITNNLAEGWLYLNVFHNLQYLSFMKNFEKKITFLILPLLITGIFVGLQRFAFSKMMLASFPLSILLTIALNFTHYTFDAVIWKKSKLPA